MPRQGVPYPSREICSLKCQIDALQRQINELMKSVNGVEGDGQGNVSLISGDPAIVINNDQAQHEVEISLDQSQLPAADVSSVNGQTGVVDLDGADIPLNPGQSTPTVQNAVAANAGNISQLQADLNQEILDRGNADSALQSNINTVSAGIPAAAAAAVAADPTVAQLAVDVPNKLDKITSGSALKAYTHTGATQGEKSVVDGTTADSIAIRDANGRLQAADPASGATDKTVVTSNWVSQTGDSGPNNILHRTGNETKTAGQLKIAMPNYGYGLAVIDSGLDITNIQSQRVHTLPFLDRNSIGIANLRYVVQTNGSVLVQLEIRKTDGTYKYINLGDNS